MARHSGLAFFGRKGQNSCGCRNPAFGTSRRSGPTGTGPQKAKASSPSLTNWGCLAFCFHHLYLFSGFPEELSRGRVVAFQDFLNYNDHVDVLRFHGWARRESHPAMARWLAQEGVRKDRHANPVHAGDPGLAGAVCQCNYGMAPTRRVSRRVRRKPVSATGVLRTRAPRVHNCTWSGRKGQTSGPDTGGSR